MVRAAGAVLVGTVVHLWVVTGVAGSTKLLLWLQPMGHRAAQG
jgi:hypothetical protein